jgi:hypothetical protein
MYCQRIWHNPSDQVIIQRILVAIMKGLEPLIPLPQRLSRELRSLPTYRRGGVGKLEPFGATKLVLGSPFGNFGSYKTDTKMMRNRNFLVEN